MNNETHASNLKAWRKACGWTQAQAAAQLHASPDTITSIEIGRLELSKRMALSCEAISGVNFISMQSKVGPRGRDGRPFTERHFQEHRDAREQAVFASKLQLQHATS